MVRSLILITILLSLSACKEDGQVLPEATADGILTIDGVDFQANYGMIKNFEPDGNNLNNYHLVLSDYPIGWDENGQFFSSPEKSFSIIISFLTFENDLTLDSYEFWNPENNPEPFGWVISHMHTRGISSGHPDSGTIVLSELDGTYSIIMNLDGNEDQNLASVRGVASGQFETSED